MVRDSLNILETTTYSSLYMLCYKNYLTRSKDIFDYRRRNWSITHQGIHYLRIKGVISEQEMQEGLKLMEETSLVA